MKSLLSQLYEGELMPVEMYVNKGQEFLEKRREHYNHYDNFIHKLSLLDPPLDKEFIQIMDEQLDTVPIDFSETFIHGFKMGSRMMVEIFQEDYSNGIYE